ncbi:MAG: NAD(P)-dependent alcohol dehydrogenase [Thalassobius sp.]|nr:NAD(P)-dependent alcohol dehydrogenase [Thalassovita sp.]
MKAIVYENYGSPEVLNLVEMEKPVPKDNEVLVAIKASTATAPDAQMRKGTPYIGRLYTGINGPKRKIPGYEFAGEVVAIGKNVKQFKTGDLVFGGSTTLGCYAEYKCIAEDDLILKIPAKLSFEDVVPLSNSAVTALNFLKIAKIKTGQKILIIGASGAVGSYAVQIANNYGADVTAVCSTQNVSWVKSLGVNKVIDYKQGPIQQQVYKQKFDIVFDAVGKYSFSTSKNMLSENGCFLTVNLSFALLGNMIWTSIFSKKKVIFTATGAASVANKIQLLKEVLLMAENGNLKSMIDKGYSIQQCIEAHKYVDTGRKSGNVVITI